MSKIAIIGTTSWGITLGMVLDKKGQEVRIWARTEEEARRLRNNGPHPRLLPDVPLPSELSVTSSLSEALAYVDAVLIVVPSQSMRRNIRLIKDYLTSSMLVITLG